LDINLSSITSQKPPAPDILCSLLSGEKIAFELVEIIDNGIASGINDSITLQSRLNEESRESQLPIIEVPGGVVGVDFKSGITMNFKLRAIPSILEEISQMPADFVGNKWAISNSKCKEAVSRIGVSRSTSSYDTVIQVASVTSFGDPLVDKNKC
jgi:hypothetical protein